MLWCNSPPQHKLKWLYRGRGLTEGILSAMKFEWEMSPPYAQREQSNYENSMSFGHGTRARTRYFFSRRRKW